MMTINIIGLICGLDYSKETKNEDWETLNMHKASNIKNKREVRDLNLEPPARWSTGGGGLVEQHGPVASSSESEVLVFFIQLKTKPKSSAKCLVFVSCPFWWLLIQHG